MGIPDFESSAFGHSANLPCFLILPAKLLFFPQTSKLFSKYFFILSRSLSQKGVNFLFNPNSSLACRKRGRHIVETWRAASPVKLPCCTSHQVDVVIPWIPDKGRRGTPHLYILGHLRNKLFCSAKQVISVNKTSYFRQQNKLFSWAKQVVFKCPVFYMRRE